MQPDKRHTSLKKQLECLAPLLEDLRLKKEERIKQLADVKTQIDKINAEILGHFHLHSNGVEEHDLSLRKLNEYRTHLQTLQNEKVYLVNLLLSTYVLTTCFLFHCSRAVSMILVDVSDFCSLLVVMVRY